jgi:prephenate dehydrogenase
MPPLFDQVTIIGVGLIGGSLGLALRRGNLARLVVGVGHRQASIDRALEMGAVDHGTLDPLEGVKGAELVVLGTAVRLIVEMGKKVAPHLSPGAIVTDVGSTKSEIVRRLEETLPAGVSFVGAHPIAGSEKRGVDSARPDLFEKSVCVLTPTADTDPKAMRRVAGLWTAVGARVLSLSCEEHDRVLARTSHLPHLVAAALVASLATPDTPFVGPGLRDTTRIAAGDVDVWCDVFLTNRDAVLQALAGFTAQVSELRRAVESGDRAKLADLLAAAKSRRDSLAHE